MQYGHVLILAVGENEHHAHDKVEDGVLLRGWGVTLCYTTEVTGWCERFQREALVHDKAEGGVRLQERGEGLVGLLKGLFPY